MKCPQSHLLSAQHISLYKGHPKSCFFSAKHKALEEAPQVPWFLPPNPPVSSREEAMRAWSLRVVGAPRLDCSCFASFVSHRRPRHACSLTASFFCSVGGSVACKTPSFNGVVWGAVSSRQNSTLRRGTQVMFLPCKTQSSRRGTPRSCFFSADKSLRRGTPSPPCIVPRDAVERMVVSCERSERGADAGTARKTSIVPRTQ